MTSLAIPKAFVRKRLHSLAGLWLMLFLLEHLFTNSQAALWLGDDGKGFIQMVNTLHNLPYLQAIEITLLGIPFLYHMVWGIKYALSAKLNAHKTDGTTPSLRQYGRNRAFSWQRITSWILLFGLIGHVVQFRFLDAPQAISDGEKTAYFVVLEQDNGLPSLCRRLGVSLYKQDTSPLHKPLKEGLVIAKSADFGTATLLTVRNAFKNPLYMFLYTIFVLAACFHAFNGFWTFLLSWGLIIKRAAQQSFIALSLGLMFLVAFLGLAAIYGTWFNLRQ